MKYFIFLLFFILSFDAYSNDEGNGTTGGPKIQKVETIDVTTILPELRPKDKVEAVNVFDLTNNAFVIKPQKPMTLRTINKEVKTFDDLLERVNGMRNSQDSQLKPMQLLVPVNGLQGMRIDGQYFNREEFVGAEQILIDQTRDYEVFFRNGEVLDLEALPTLLK